MAPSGARMWMRMAPPTRASSSQTGLVKPFGPHHCASVAASVQALNTSARGASKVRVMVISRSASSLPGAAVDMGKKTPLYLLRHDHHPGDAEFVGQHAEARREESLGERHRHLAFTAEGGENLVGFGLVLGEDR